MPNLSVMTISKSILCVSGHILFPGAFADQVGQLRQHWNLKDFNAKRKDYNNGRRSAA